MSTPAKKAIKVFGGIRPMSRALSSYFDVPTPPSTIQGWSNSGRIPADRQPDVLALAEHLDLPLTAQDLIGPGTAPNFQGAAE